MSADQAKAISVQAVHRMILWICPDTEKGGPSRAALTL